MKRLYLAVLAGVLGLFGIAYWKNTFSYRTKPTRWRVVKSAVDCTLVIVAALYLPALLVSWTVAWLTRFINSRGIQVTLAVIAGIVFSSIGGVALEILCVLGIFSVDLLSGEKGVYGWWRHGPPDSFLPNLRVKEETIG